ncbi:hypothetical protein [Halovivax sp.]|uniref:hypothetical protein n=1 Tax=Halovivax sp. TaxID=1935978 RepID=UPI0025C3EE03|nr:hypothetical protein [Halovivax sp.]
MRELRRCDFCGGDAAGTFEIVPPELNPTEAEQRRVVLCDDCKAVLGELLEPLLERAGAGDGRDREAGTDDGEAGPDDGEVRGGDESGSGDGTAVSNDREARSSDGESESDEAEGIRFDESGSAGAAGRQANGGVTVTTDQRSADPSATTGESTEGADGAGVGGSDGRPPESYGKVLRLLGNREFPMARAEVEALAAGAYDLEDPEVTAIIDHAIERGKLVEDGSQLRRR